MPSAAVFEDRKLGHQDRPIRRISKTSRDGDGEITSDAAREQLQFETVPIAMRSKTGHAHAVATDVKCHVDLLEALSVFSHYEERPCVKKETTHLTDHTHRAEGLHLNQTASVARVDLDSGSRKPRSGKRR